MKRLRPYLRTDKAYMPRPSEYIPQMAYLPIHKCAYIQDRFQVMSYGEEHETSHLRTNSLPKCSGISQQMEGPRSEFRLIGVLRSSPQSWLP